MTVNSILLTGHSNSGKSPLGNVIEEYYSTRNRKFIHFDFGSLLRSVSTGKIKCGFSDDNILFIKSILNGTLLDRNHFFIADKIFECFFDFTKFNRRSDTLILNGFPRDMNQAHFIGSKNITVISVVFLDCSTGSAALRKKLAEAGKGHEDRSDRNDSGTDIFIKKIDSFVNDTMPVINHYKKKGIPVIRSVVNKETTPDEILKNINHSLLKHINF